MRPLALPGMVGLVYVTVGRVFAWPTEHVQAWRWAAWIVSFAVLAIHLAFEQLKLRHSPRTTSWHAAFAVAIGSVGIAIAGLLTTVSQGTPVGARWLIALVVFPVFTGVPTFVGALLATTVVSRLRASKFSA
jgi:hypothetical protein